MFSVLSAECVFFFKIKVFEKYNKFYNSVYHIRFESGSTFCEAIAVCKLLTENTRVGKEFHIIIILRFFFINMQVKGHHSH